MPVPRSARPRRGSDHAAVRATRSEWVSSIGLDPLQVRHALDAPHEGDADLPADGESPSGTALAQSHRILPANIRQKPRSTIPFHPRFGEIVIVRRRLVTNKVEMAVILQPDSSLALLPAWMLDESAARFTIHESPTFSLTFLQSLRAEIDALLASLPSDSQAGDDGNASKNRDARKHPAGSVRARAARRRAVADQETGNWRR